jgi:putative addiction module component (TIGR02574 family)
MGHPAINLDELSPDEQLELLEEIWDRLSANPANVPFSEAHRRELDGRLDDLDSDIQSGRPLGEPWEDVRKRLKPR